MCDFVSWIETKNRVLFLTDANIRDWERAGDRPACPDKSERVGHGAIRLFYGLNETDGINKECTNFSSSSNFPVPIAKAIKDGKITCNLVFPKGLASDELYADYTAKRSLLYADYAAQRNLLDDDYDAKRKPVYDDYTAKLKPLDDAYAAKLTMLYADCWCKFNKIKNRAPAWR